MQISRWLHLGSVKPAAGIALLAFAFSLALRAPSLRTNFALFYATGYLPFMLYFYSAKKVANSLKFLAPSEVSRVTYVDAFIARGLLNLLTYCMIFIIVIGGITSIFQTGALVDPSDLSKPGHGRSIGFFCWSDELFLIFYVQYLGASMEYSE